MSSAIYFNDQSKILSSGNGLRESGRALLYLANKIHAVHGNLLVYKLLGCSLTPSSSGKKELNPLPHNTTF